MKKYFRIFFASRLPGSRKIKEFLIKIPIIYRLKLCFKKPSSIAMVCRTAKPGGAEMVFTNHVQFLSSEFREIDVFFPLQGGPLIERVEKYARNLYIRQCCDNVHLANNKYIYLVQYIPDLAKIKKMNPDIKVSFILHDPVLWVNELMKHRDVVEYLDHVFCISNLVRQSFLESIPMFPREKTSVLYNSLLFYTEYNAQDKQDNIVTWGYAGRLSPEKGVLEIVRNFIEFSKNHINHRLIIAGDITASTKRLIEYKERILREAHRSENIELIGYKNNLKTFYRQIDYLIMGSYIEGISVAALDALASGIPVVSSDVGSMSEIINEHNGILFKFEKKLANPFGNNKILNYSEKDNLSMRRAMEAALVKEWDREKIAQETRDKYASDVISREICNQVVELLGG